MAAAEFRCDSSPSSGPPQAPSKEADRKGLGAGIAAGSLTPALTASFHSLPHSTQHLIAPILDQHATYLSHLHTSSLARLQSVIDSPTTTGTQPHPHISRVLTLLPGSSSSRSASPAPSSPTTPTASSNRFKDDPAAGDEEQTDQTPKISTSTPGPGSYLSRWQALLDSTAITPATAHGPARYGKDADVLNRSAKDVDGAQMEERGRTSKPMEPARKETSGRADVRPVVDALLGKFRELLGVRGCYW